MRRILIDEATRRAGTIALPILDEVVLRMLYEEIEIHAGWKTRLSIHLCGQYDGVVRHFIEPLQNADTVMV